MFPLALNLMPQPGGLASRPDEDAHYDDVVDFDASDIEPTVTWGVTPAQAIGVGRKFNRNTGSELDQELVTSALDYMKLRADAD